MLAPDRDRLRQALDSAHVLRTARRARFAYVVGPLNPYLVRWHRAHARNPPLPTTSSTWRADIDTAAVAATIERAGWAMGPSLPASMAAEVLRWFEEEGTGRSIDPHLRCGAVRDIAMDEVLVETARRYLGADPILFDTTIWRSDAVSTRGGMFHYDVGDYRSLVVFFYLSDVDVGSGEHAVIEGTHGRKSFRDLWFQRLTDEDAEARYGSRIRTIVGPAGTGWFEDLSAFHKKCAAARPRVILKISYMLRRDPRSRASIVLPGRWRATA